jgi:hypothetical protein
MAVLTARLTIAERNALRAVRDKCVYRQGFDATGRTRFQFFLPEVNRRCGSVPMWVSVASRSVNALHRKGLVQFGEQRVGVSEECDWQQEVLLTDEGIEALGES